VDLPHAQIASEPRAEKAEAALKKIASCESYHKDDVVAIARAALGI
jgi:hypothetical protein